MKCLVAIVLAATAMSSAAYAQGWRGLNDPDAKGPRISTNFQIATPVGVSPTAAQMTKALAEANQSLYEIVNRQCDVLAAAFKGECRILQLNVTGNINERMGMSRFVNGRDQTNPQQFVNTSANAVFEVDPPTPAKDATEKK